MGFREELRALCAGEEKPSQAEVSRVLQGVDKLELLDFLVEESEKLLAMVEDIPNLILDGLEDKLPTDEASKQAADAVMAKLLAQK